MMIKYQPHLLGVCDRCEMGTVCGASIVFEQSYGGVDGDSASSAELYALLSSLAKAPLMQSLAVTGSVNQFGQVQAIGGVNEKIEGFFDICKARGLTGDQGVLIPASNVKHLMLRPDVVEAASGGKFHIYPVETIAQGIHLLTGKAINRFRSGIIILAASGMCEAGRIRHHLKNHLWRRQASVLIVGYMAEGTLGRLLVDGVKKVKIQGEDIDVNATIRKIDTYSGHADESELIDWILQRRPIRRKLFLTHGEKEAAEALRTALVKKNISSEQVVIPSLDDEITLDDHGREGKFADVSHRISADVLSGLDWHNDLAQLQLDLKDAFEKSADQRTRATLLRKIRRALEKE